MKITFAANHGEVGGGEVMLMQLAGAARHLGHDVTIVAPSSPSDVVQQARDEGFRTVEIHADSASQYLLGLRRFDNQRDGWLWCNGLRPAVATAGHRRRVVHLHQVPTKAQRALAWTATRGASKVLVPSRFMERAVGLGSEVLWNWCDGVRVQERTLPDDGPIRLGFIGRLAMDKGIGQLAEAVTRLNATGGNYRLVLAGEPRFVDDAGRDEVERALRPIASVTDRLGWVERDEFYGQVDIVVVPSVVDEAFGLVVAEAMSSQLPLVVTRSGAVPEIVGGGYPLMAKPGSATDLVRVIKLATTREDTELVRDNYFRWRGVYSPDAGAERLADVLTDLRRAGA